MFLIINALWDFVLTLLAGISSLWDWLNNPINLNIDLGLFKIGIPTFTPLSLVGAGLIGLVIWWFIKSLVPVA